MLTESEIGYLLQLLAEKHGFGYSQDHVEGDRGPVKVGALQAKLSLMLEVAHKMAAEKQDRTRGIRP
jgi:hypothetical protein